MRTLCTLETRPLSAANDFKRSTESAKPSTNLVGFPLYPSESPCFPQENTAVSMSCVTAWDESDGTAVR